MVRWTKSTKAGLQSEPTLQQKLALGERDGRKDEPEVIRGDEEY